MVDIRCWSQQAKVVVDDAAAGDYFGQSVAPSGDTALVGADGDDDAGSDSGAAGTNGIGRRPLAQSTSSRRPMDSAQTSLVVPARHTHANAGYQSQQQDDAQVAGFAGAS